MSGDFLLINEVGLRDGLQNQRIAVGVDDKLRLVGALVAAGVQAIEATSFVSPKAVPQMADADLLFPRMPPGPRYSALVPNERGLARALAADVPEIAVVLSATETMNQRNIRMTLAEAQAECQRTLGAARAAGLRTKAYVAVAFECPYEGPVAAGQVHALVDAMAGAGADTVVIADTIGAAAPKAVAALLREAVARHGTARLAAHFHDTRGMALANAWVSLEAGLRQLDSSLGGLGGCPFAPGAAGNLATEDLLLMASQCGLATGIDMGALLQAVELAAALTQQALGGRSHRWLTRQRAA